jgi:PKD repeat protein
VLFVWVCRGLLCEFIAVGSTTATGHRWDFGDGATAAGISVEHEFGVPGSYDVTLEIATAGDTISSVRTLQVTS